MLKVALMELEKDQIKRLKRKIALGGAITVVFVISLWLIDISISALNTGGMLTSGFWTVDPSKMFHLGLYLAIGSFLCLWFLLIESFFERGFL